MENMSILAIRYYIVLSYILINYIVIHVGMILCKSNFMVLSSKILFLLKECPFPIRKIPHKMKENVHINFSKIRCLSVIRFFDLRHPWLLLLGNSPPTPPRRHLSSLIEVVPFI